MRKLTTLLIATSLLALQTATATPVVKETISVEGKLGTIKEERVKSVQSTITFVPAGNVASYDLIDLSDTGIGESEHAETEEIAIPSWTIFSW